MAFSYYRGITIDHTLCGGSDSSNFPALVSTAPAAAGVLSTLKSVGNGGHVQSSSGYDIWFYSDSGLTTRLPAERVTYDPTTGIGEWWVNVPTLSHSADTVIYIAYGDASVVSDPNSDATYGTTQVWDSHFKAVYHLKDGSTLSLADSTSNANNGTNNGATATTGQIDGGAAFVSASSEFINIGHGASLALTGDLTLEAWVNPNGNASPDTEIIARDDNVNGRGYNLQLASGSLTPYFYFNGGPDGALSGTNPLTNLIWNYVVGTMSGTAMAMYLNGAANGTATGTTPHASATGDVYIGARTYSGFPGYFNGSLDELRISDVGRSADWVLATYNNGAIPDKNAGAGGFYTVGSETSTAVPFSQLPNVVLKDRFRPSYQQRF